MEGGEDKVAGLGGAKGDQGGVLIADFPEEDDVRALSQRGAQGARERGGVRSDLPLREVGEIVFKEVLHRILDRHDVAAMVVVDPVEAARDRGGFPAAGGSADDDESAAAGEPGHEERRGQAELLEVGHIAFDGAEHGAEGAEAFEEIHPQARAILGGPAEVLFLIGNGVRADLFPEQGDLIVSERMAFEGNDLAIDADPGRMVFGEDQVGRSLGEGGADVVEDGRH